MSKHTARIASIVAGTILALAGLLALAVPTYGPASVTMAEADEPTCTYHDDPAGGLDGIDPRRLMVAAAEATMDTPDMVTDLVGYEYVMGVQQMAGYGYIPEEDFSEYATEVPEPRCGDLVLDGEGWGIYVGDGRYAHTDKDTSAPAIEPIGNEATFYSFEW